MNINENISQELTLEMSLEEMALEVDKFYAKLPEDATYGQNEMIEIIKSLKKDYPKFFMK